MLQFAAIVGFMMFAIVLMAVALHFSQYKKRENAGCCGGGHCSTDGHDHDHECDGTGSCTSGGHDHGCSTGTCYSSKEDFVNNFDKIKIEKMELRNQ